MVSLMETGGEAHVGGTVLGGERTFAIAGHSWGIITESGQSAFPNIEVGADDIVLTQDTCLLKIAVGEGPSGVFVGDDLLLDGKGKWAAPNNGGMLNSEDNTSHARFGSITSSQNNWVIRHNFCKSCGATG